MVAGPKARRKVSAVVYFILIIGFENASLTVKSRNVKRVTDSWRYERMAVRLLV